ncbi:hypothetical protein CNMCM5793_005250 [Aspergillus hiratsukae]|uniref:Uncharacterized protein n=1 Tax=Aspergillus hiratsukae TaxID=1194566 RepID=A0A8H6UGE9_9EURO|nr:hypothetical protein CNMCM5793_005250 [Aspergillus hiratsukae]
MGSKAQSNHAIKLRGAGGASAQGTRPSQQDQYTIILPDQIPKATISDELAIFAIYDGHGSRKVAQHAKGNIRELLFQGGALAAGRYEDAIREAIQKEEEMLLEECQDGEEKFAISGSTVSMVIVNLTKGVLVVGNLGDSHVLMGESDITGQLETVRRLTQDHKPDNPREKEKIEDAGGMVNYAFDTARIGALNMSRALGDLQYKNPLNNDTAGPSTAGQELAAMTPSIEQGNFLSTEPSITQVDLKKDRRYILALTTDGVTNVLEDNVIINEIKTRHEGGLGVQQVADELVGDVAEGLRRDNATFECIRYGDNDEHYAYEETWETAADDTFAIIHTTGSTGMPKPVLMPQSSIAAVDAHRLVSSRVGKKSVLEILAEADMPFLGFPLFHTAGLLQCCFLLLSCCTLMLPNPNKPVSRHMVREIFKTSEADAALLPPSVLDDVAQDEQLIQDLSRCRYIMFGSIKARTGDALSQRVRLINSIGSAECGSFVQFPVESEHWNCYHFSEELNGIQWRRFDPQPDKYEMIITRSDAASEFQAVFKNFPDLNEFETKDLFSKHETIQDYWVYEGRRDDVVVLSTGEHLNPLDIESAICEKPSIQGALVFGSGLPNPGLLIELDNPKENEQLEEIKQRVMDILRDTYRRSPDFVRIPQGNIVFANRDKPFVRTPKGTVQRRHTLQAYQKEIDALFEPSRGGFDDQHLSLDLSSEEAFAGSLVKAVAKITDTDSLDTDSDFFEAGMNSQQAEMLIANVRDAIRKEPNCGLDERKLNEDPIYSQTSATKLASYMFRPSQASRDRQDDRLQAMSRMLDKYISSLPSTGTEVQHQPHNQEHILLTGSTGFVGSRLLRAFCRRASPKKITCINRKNTARSTSKATETMNGSPSSTEVPTVQYLTGDLSAEKLGLEEQTYAELADSVTTIVHCQWPVTFKQPLSFFEPQFQALVNLVHFVVASKLQPQIIFLSSISTVANWDHDSPVPETLLTPLEYAQTGYGESKLIASLLLHKAGELAGVRASICRLGQVAGPVHTDGLWPDRDWFPILLRSSRIIGYLPDSLGSQGHLDWIPVDILSELLADLTEVDGRELPSEQVTSYYHFVNPNRATWESIVPTVLDELEGKCKTTTLSDWVKKLEQHSARPEKSDEQPPGVQLLDFYRSLEDRPLEMETQHTRQRITAIRNISPKMDTLPVEIILAIGSHLCDVEDRLQLLRVCRRWRALFLEVTYNHVYVGGPQIEPLTKVILANPRIGAAIRNLSLGWWNSYIDRHRQKSESDDTLPAAVKELVDQISKSPEEGRDWTADLQVGNEEAWLALLLASVPNLIALSGHYFHDAPTVTQVVARAARKEPPFDRRPALQRLESLHITSDDSKTAYPHWQFLPFFHLPSLRDVDLSGVYEIKHPAVSSASGTSPVESLALEYNCNGRNGMREFVTSCANLKHFKYQHDHKEIWGASCVDFQPRKFYRALLTQKHSLEVLHLSDDGDVAGAGEGDLSDDEDDDGPEAYDRWFGSLAEFSQLQDLRIRVQNLLNYHDRDKHEFIVLKGILPPSLRSLHVAECLEQHCSVLVPNLQGLLHKEQFPSLEQISISAGLAEEIPEEPKPGCIRGVRIPESFKEMFVEVAEMSDRVGMDSPASSNQGRDGGPRKYAFNREGAREREMHLYLPYWGFSDSEKFAQQSIGKHPNVSRDNVLTVFAQLAALRMHASRALISLFDKTMQHVVAEATPDLSLRAADGRDRADALWLGVRRLPRQKVTMCYYAVKSFIEEGRDIFVANDLTSDDRFENHPSVTGHPHNKFYVSVPITSPDDYVIGSLAVLDDRPRDGVTEEQAHLLKELSATIMDHLLCQRAMREEYREEKMVRALGLFVKGKSDLNEWFDSGDARDKKYGGQFAQLNQRLEKLQVSRSSGQDGEDGKSEDGKDGQDDNAGDGGNDQDKEMAKAGKAGNAGNHGHHGRHGSPVQRFKQDGEEEADEEVPRDKPDGKSHKKHRPTLSPTTSQLQDTLAPSNVRSVVNRAASMIYQALDVEGAMFIDASVYARRQTVGFTDSKLDDPEAYSLQRQADNGGEEQAATPSNPESRSDTDASDDDSQSRSLVLGHYTSSTSEGGVNLKDSHYVSLSGGFVSYLIDQYPRGKIFHIEEDGSISLSYEGLADEMHYSQTGNRGAMSTEPEKKDVQQETMDIKEMMKVLPDARCIAVYPVWDFQRGRWFTVCVVWTNDPGRVLSEPKDLTYLAAFSNTVMAEVSRLDLEAADRAKSDFISSISHELRSPLHGLLGTVELLQEMVNSYAQKSLIETVYSCGRTLLDTLNHLLDYAKINTLTRPRPSDRAGGHGSDVSKPQTAVPGSLQDENLSVLVQEVVEGLLAGAEYQRRGANGDSDALAKKEDLGPKNRLITIVDIEWQDSWQFSVYAGAWRRVVMNLFGNALKYTQTGYIRLRMRRDSLLVDGKRTPAIRMTFSDSGRGMSKDFLTNHLYSAFLQEDTTSPGLGVGLHLVHQIVKSLKGQIKFSSEVGKGTDVDVVLPMEMPEQSSPSSPRSFAPLKEQLSGKTVSLFTRSSKLGDLGFDSRVFDRIRTSLGRMVSGWFGLRVLTPDELDSSKPDFAIVTEHEYRNYYIEGSNEPKPDSGEIQPALPLIVLSARTSSWKILGESVEDSVIFLTQPVSPKTLATAFEHCLGQPERSSTSTPRKLPSPVPPEDKIPDAEKMFEGRRNGEKDRVLDSVLGRTVNGEAGQQQPSDRKGGKNILLVEDNQVNLKIVEMCVKTAGFAYDTAKNGLEALEKFKADTYDAVVMDISMPVMDGLTATRQMRLFERKTKRPPTTIIILTAVLSASMQHEAMMSGVNLFLTKPTPLKQLKEILRNLSDGKDVSQN